jgi:hypothetical protein
MKSVGGFVAFLVILGIGWAIRSGSGSNMSDKYLWQSKAFVAQADKYDEHREYFDWLVETAHNDVFEDSYSRTYGRRGRSRSHMDVEKYENDIIARMIELARQNDYHDVADSIERLVDPDAAERQKAAAKSAKKRK